MGGQKQLKAYLQRLEEAEKRDHRKIGKALNLFHMQEQAPAWCFGTPMAGQSGKYLNNICEKYKRQRLS